MTSKPTPGKGSQIISLEVQFGSALFNENFVDFDPNGIVSIRAKILNYPTVEIHENDFCDDCSTQDETFSKGQLLLIPIPEEMQKSLREDFKINIQVMKTSLPEDLLPVREAIGYTNVNLARTFNNLLCSIGTVTSRECPSVKLMSDQLEIIETDTGTIIGTINIYVRLKAFGKCIVTAMQDVLENKGRIFDKCYNPKDTCEDDEESICPPGFLNASLMRSNNYQSNEYQQLTADSSKLNLKVRVSKPVKSDVNMKESSKSEPVKSGTISLGKDNILFKDGHSDQSSEDNTGNVKYEMKTGRTAPQSQTFQMMPAPTLGPTLNGPAGPHYGPLTGLPMDTTADVYYLSVTKKNTAMNRYASVQMEARVPRKVKPAKERFTRDVQYLTTDIAPPAPAKGATKGKKK